MSETEVPAGDCAVKGCGAAGQERDAWFDGTRLLCTRHAEVERWLNGYGKPWTPKERSA